MIKFFNFCSQKKNCNFIRKTFYSLVNGPIINFNFNSNTFFENQTKPIVKLAKAAEKFGKGDYVNEFKTSGALEIRKASYEFDRMAKRINRHLKQRSEMLSGISHDLRTPLTRLKLQLAMLSQKDISKNMSNDIDEMEKMLNDYLEFSKLNHRKKQSKLILQSF